MADPGAASPFPVPTEDVVREILYVINRDGVNNLRSKAVRKHLTDKFNHNFDELKVEVDKVIEREITAKLEAEMDPTPAPKPLPTPAAAAPTKDASSDSDSSDPGVASTGRMPRGKKHKSAARKRSVDQEIAAGNPDDDMHSAVKRRRAATKVAKPKTPRESKGGKKKGSSYSSLCYISEDLQEITGQGWMPRHEVVKSVWAYVREHNLQDPKNKQFVISDDKMQKVFKRRRFKIFGMMGMLKDHVVKPDELGPEYVQAAEEERVRREALVVPDSDDDVKKEVEEGGENEAEEDGDGDEGEDDKDDAENGDASNGGGVVKEEEKSAVDDYEESSSEED